MSSTELPKTKKELIEYIATNYDDFNYKSGSDAPDKMLEEIEALVELEDRIRWLLTHANIKNLTEWAKEIHHDLAEKECNPDYMY